ncbi:MAG: hypothetical protein KBC66_02200 [Kiritimatiellae bacterium]|jgi:hypothetical protein|nr:hypothetical protein [Kiritimatiellia bacterium]NLD89868.1 hypothetical protein [Lentisphaerota bacterium]HPC18958.1 hypothetical protein [Kiritimatiellia bacterium]
MKRLAWMGVLAAALALGAAGCDWDTGSDAEHWSGSYDWVNFSGVYRGSVTTTLDPDYQPAATNSKVDTFTMFRFQTQQNGKTTRAPIAKGSVTITVAGAGLTDPDHDGQLTGPLGTGSFNYDNGTWAIDILPAYRNDDENQSIYVAYGYVTEESGTEFGAAQTEAYSFTVHQNGEKLSITENTGASYSGRITQMRSASGVEMPHSYDRKLPENGDVITASFEASGSGGRIVGTLQGVVEVGVFNDRRMDGTKITAGSSDDITAVAPAVEITIVSTAPTGTDTGTGTESTETNTTD